MEPHPEEESTKTKRELHDSFSSTALNESESENRRTNRTLKDIFSSHKLGRGAGVPPTRTRRAAALEMAGGHGHKFADLTVHAPKRWQVLTGQGMCAVMWLWVLYRAKNDGPVLLGWRHPWDGHGHGHSQHGNAPGKADKH